MQYRDGLEISFFLIVEQKKYFFVSYSYTIRLSILQTQVMQTIGKNKHWNSLYDKETDFSSARRWCSIDTDFGTAIRDRERETDNYIWEYKIPESFNKWSTYFANNINMIRTCDIIGLKKIKHTFANASRIFTISVSSWQRFLCKNVKTNLYKCINILVCLVYGWHNCFLKKKKKSSSDF